MSRSRWVVVLVSALLVVEAGEAAAARPRIVVGPPEIRDVALFPEEAARLHEALHAFVAKQRLPGKLVPLAEVRAAVAVGEGGRLAPDGPVCALEPAVDDVLEARFPGAVFVSSAARYMCRPIPESPRPAGTAGREGAVLSLLSSTAETSFACDEEFRLDVSLTIGEGKGARTRRWTTSVAQPASVAGWLAAIRRLEPPGPTKSLLSMLAMLNRPQDVLIDVTDATPAGDWSGLSGYRRSRDGGGALAGGVWGISDAFAVAPRVGAPPEPPAAPPRAPRHVGELVEPHRERLATCHRPGLEATLDVALAVDAVGRVERCHATVESMGATADLGDCVCRALAEGTFPGGADGRRLALTLDHYAEPLGTKIARGYAYFGEVAGPDTAGTHRSLGVAADTALRCFPSATPRLELPVRFVRDAAGGVTEVTLGEAAALPNEARACIEAALRATPFACPSTAPAPLEGPLTFVPPSTR